MQLRVRRSRRLAVATALALALLGAGPRPRQHRRIPGAATAQLDRRQRARRPFHHGHAHRLRARRPGLANGARSDARRCRRARGRRARGRRVPHPVGTFPSLDQAFGRLPNPGTKMPYFQTSDQGLVGRGPRLTHLQPAHHGASSPSSDAENLYDSGSIYDYAVNIAVNPQRVPGNSSGIFLHVSDGDPTWGCVAIGVDEMRSVLRWLSTRRRRRTSPSAWGHSTAMTCPYCGGEVGDTDICPRCGLPGRHRDDGVATRPDGAPRGPLLRGWPPHRPGARRQEAGR